jgi:hypothetical protein
MLLLAGMVSVAPGQSVFLKVKAAGSKQEEKTTIQGTGGSAYTRTVHIFRQETIEISVRNTSLVAGDYLIEWLFLSTRAKGGDAEPCHANEIPVCLGANTSVTFQATSPKLEATQNYQHSPGGGLLFGGEKVRFLGTDGVKPAGFVVRVKAGGRIIAVEASDAQLKRRYQSLSAPWTPPDNPSK